MLVEGAKYGSTVMLTRACTIRHIMLSLTRSARFCNHLCDTDVVICYKSCRLSLDHLNLMIV